jgi:folate-dependent phosphoribosylglycinamide formyltransferase PurN
MSRGSNLKAMAEYFLQKNLPVKIIFVIRTQAEAPIAEVCDAYNITCHYLPYRGGQEFEEKLMYLLEYHSIHLLALAGFLKKLSAEFISNAGVPILNIHPALLPKYGGKGMYGMAVHQAVYADQEQVSGATIHLVNELYDEGDVLAQLTTDISSCQNTQEVAQAVLKVEHDLYGKTIWSYLQKLYG